jgi:plastocyanin
MLAIIGEWWVFVPIASRSGRRKGQPMSWKLVHLRRLLLVTPFAVALVLVSVAAVGLMTPNKADAQATQAIDIANFAFSPASVTIEAGTTVTWTNSDSATHNVTDNGGAFASGDLATGQSYSYTFDTEGTYNYMCTIHPQMLGTIVVTAAGGEPTATAPATATEAPTGMPATGSGSSMSSAASQTNVLLIAAVVAAMLGLVALRLRHVADRK